MAKTKDDTPTKSHADGTTGVLRSKTLTRKPKYTLDTLLVGYDADAPISVEERIWIDVPPAGREVW